MRQDPQAARAVRAGLGMLLVLVGLLAPAVGHAADARIGYIDSARIWIEFKDAAEAQQRFERQVQGWRDEAAEKQKAVDALKAEVKEIGRAHV